MSCDQFGQQACAENDQVARQIANSLDTSDPRLAANALRQELYNRPPALALDLLQRIQYYEQPGAGADLRIEPQMQQVFDGRTYRYVDNGSKQVFVDSSLGSEQVAQLGGNQQRVGQQPFDQRGFDPYNQAYDQYPEDYGYPPNPYDRYRHYPPRGIESFLRGGDPLSMITSLIIGAIGGNGRFDPWRQQRRGQFCDRNGMMWMGGNNGWDRFSGMPNCRNQNQFFPFGGQYLNSPGRYGQRFSGYPRQSMPPDYYDYRQGSQISNPNQQYRQYGGQWQQRNPRFGRNQGQFIPGQGQYDPNQTGGHWQNWRRQRQQHQRQSDQGMPPGQLDWRRFQNPGQNQGDRRFHTQPIENDPRFRGRNPADQGHQFGRNGDRPRFQIPENNGRMPWQNFQHRDRGDRGQVQVPNVDHQRRHGGDGRQFQNPGQQIRLPSHVVQPGRQFNPGQQQQRGDVRPRNPHHQQRIHQPNDGRRQR